MSAFPPELLGPMDIPDVAMCAIFGKEAKPTRENVIEWFEQSAKGPFVSRLNMVQSIDGDGASKRAYMTLAAFFGGAGGQCVSHGKTVTTTTGVFPFSVSNGCAHFTGVKPPYLRSAIEELLMASVAPTNGNRLFVFGSHGAISVVWDLYRERTEPPGKAIISTAFGDAEGACSLSIGGRQMVLVPSWVFSEAWAMPKEWASRLSFIDLDAMTLRAPDANPFQVKNGKSTIEFAFQHCHPFQNFFIDIDPSE